MSDNETLTEPELSSLLEDLGAPPNSATQKMVDTIVFPYNGRLRNYHDVDHLDEMSAGEMPEALQVRLTSSSKAQLFGEAEDLQEAQPHEVLKKAKAIMRFSGYLHDSAYKQIDGAENEENVWPEILKEQIGSLLDAAYETDPEKSKRRYNTRLTDEGKANPVVRMAAEIFAVSDEGISTTQGGNEFDSAVVAAKLLEKHSGIAAAQSLRESGIDAKTILAIVTCIAATYPFQQASEEGYPDGYMGRLAERLHTVSQREHLNMSWNDINQIMLLAVQTANNDVADFFGGIPVKEGASFVDIAHGAALLKAEEIAELRSDQEQDVTIQGLMRLATLSRSAPFLYKQMQDPEFPVQPGNVPHFYLLRDENGDVIPNSHYPTKQEYTAAVERVRENTRLAIEYFEAKKVGVTVVAALEKLVREPKESPVKVLDFVKGKMWVQSPPEEILSNRTDEEILVYEALAKGRGKGPVSKLEIDTSPTAGVIYGYAGREGMDALYNLDVEVEEGETQKLKDMEEVKTKEQARQILKAVVEKTEPKALEIITGELARVALQNNNRKRKEALLAIGEQYKNPSSEVQEAGATAVTVRRADRSPG